MITYTELTALWKYFSKTKSYEKISSIRNLISSFVLFKKSVPGTWVHLLLITSVYLIEKIRLIYSPGTFQFTVSIIIDTDIIGDTTLSEKDLYYFWGNKRHPRLLQVTIGLSITGDNWYNELEQLIAEVSERYRNSLIYGLGVTLYGASSDRSATESLSLNEMKNAVWSIVKAIGDWKEDRKSIQHKSSTPPPARN